MKIHYDNEQYKTLPNSTNEALFPVGDVTFILPPGVSCNNTHFNSDVAEQDEYSLDTKTIVFGDDPYDEALWQKMDPKVSLKLYEDKHLLYYVAVEMVIDHTEMISHVIKRSDTEAGKHGKKESCRNSHKARKIAEKTAKPDLHTSGK